LGMLMESAKQRVFLKLLYRVHDAFGLKLTSPPLMGGVKRLPRANADSLPAIAEKVVSLLTHRSDCVDL
jgi:hypothetical protein